MGGGGGGGHLREDPGPAPGEEGAAPPPHRPGADGETPGAGRTERARSLQSSTQPSDPRHGAHGTCADPLVQHPGKRPLARGARNVRRSPGPAPSQAAPGAERGALCVHGDSVQERAERPQHGAGRTERARRPQSWGRWSDPRRGGHGACAEPPPARAHSPRRRQPSAPSQLSRTAQSSPSSTGGRSKRSVCAESWPRAPPLPAAAAQAIALPPESRARWRREARPGRCAPAGGSYTTAEILLLRRRPGRPAHVTPSALPGCPRLQAGLPARSRASGCSGCGTCLKRQSRGRAAARPGGPNYGESATPGPSPQGLSPGVDG